MPTEERAQLRAVMRVLGVAGTGIYDADGCLQKDNVVYDDDLRMLMDDPRYPRW